MLRDARGWFHSCFDGETGPARTSYIVPVSTPKSARTPTGRAEIVKTVQQLKGSVGWLGACRVWLEMVHFVLMYNRLGSFRA